MAEPERESHWRWFGKTILVPLLTAIITLTGAVMTGWFSFENKDRQLDIEMITISLAILKGDYTSEDSRDPIHARRFALRALAHYSGIPLTEKEIESWAQGGSLPYSWINTKTKFTKETSNKTSPLLCAWLYGRETFEYEVCVGGLADESNSAMDALIEQYQGKAKEQVGNGVIVAPD